MRLLRLQMSRLAAPRTIARATTEKKGIVESGVSRSHGGGAGDGGGGGGGGDGGGGERSTRSEAKGFDCATVAAIPQQMGQLARMSARSMAVYPAGAA